MGLIMPCARVTSDLTEVAVLAKVHHCGWVNDAAVVTIGERRNVALTKVLDHFKQVGSHVKLGGLTSCIRFRRLHFGKGVTYQGSSNHLSRRQLDRLP